MLEYPEYFLHIRKNKESWSRCSLHSLCRGKSWALGPNTNLPSVPFSLFRILNLVYSSPILPSHRERAEALDCWKFKLWLKCLPCCVAQSNAEWWQLPTAMTIQPKPPLKLQSIPEAVVHPWSCSSSLKLQSIPEAQHPPTEGLQHSILHWQLWRHCVKLCI